MYLCVHSIFVFFIHQTAELLATLPTYIPTYMPTSMCLLRMHVRACTFACVCIHRTSIIYIKMTRIHNAMAVNNAEEPASVVVNAAWLAAQAPSECMHLPISIYIRTVMLRSRIYAVCCGRVCTS